MNVAFERAENPAIGTECRGGSGSGFARSGGSVPRVSRRGARTSAALIAAGIVFVPALPAHAAPVYEYNYRGVEQGSYQQTIPFELNATTTSVTAFGERVDYRISLQYGEVQQGWQYDVEAFRGTLDLSAIADDVEDLDDVFDDMWHTPVQDLTFERVGDTVTFEGEFDPAYDSFEITFSVEYAPGGDGSFGPKAHIETRGNGGVNGYRWDYAPWADLGIRTIAANPAPVIAKSVDRTTVTSEEPRARYTIAVTKPIGPSMTNTFTLEDDLVDVLAESGGVEPTDVLIERGDGAFGIQNGILRGTGIYDATGEFLLTFTTPLVGSGDGVLTNTACAIAPDRTTTVQTDPAKPVTNSPQDGSSKSAPVPGGSACASAPDVRLEGFVPPVLPEEPEVEVPEVEVPEQQPPASAPAAEPDALANTGGDDAVSGILAGAGLAALGGALAFSGRGRGRRTARAAE